MLFMGKKLIIGIVVFAVVLLAAIIFVPVFMLGLFADSNPSQFLPERCSINPSFACLEFNALRDGGSEEGTGKVNVLLSNQVNQTLESVSVEELRMRGVVVNADCFVDEEFPLEADQDFLLSCDNIPNSDWNSVGEKQGFEMVMMYKARGRELYRSLTIDLYIDVR